MTDTGALRTTPAQLEQLLSEHGVQFRRYDHPPVFTCEQTREFVPTEAAGVQTKNLFMRDKRGRSHWLLVTSCDKAVDLKQVAPSIGANHLSLASPERLARYLGVDPGSVTVFGLINDHGRDVQLVVDGDLWRAESWLCHPLVNTATLVVTRADIERFLAATGHVPQIIQITPRASSFATDDTDDT
jgi:Ala-tRNA(Pro) deacylase